MRCVTHQPIFGFNLLLCRFRWSCCRCRCLHSLSFFLSCILFVSFRLRFFLIKCWIPNLMDILTHKDLLFSLSNNDMWWGNVGDFRSLFLFKLNAFCLTGWKISTSFFYRYSHFDFRVASDTIWVGLSICCFDLINLHCTMLEWKRYQFSGESRFCNPSFLL